MGGVEYRFAIWRAGMGVFLRIGRQPCKSLSIPYWTKGQGSVQSGAKASSKRTVTNLKWRAPANTPESVSSPARKTSSMLNAWNAARFLTRTNSATWKLKKRSRTRRTTIRTGESRPWPNGYLAERADFREISNAD